MKIIRLAAENVLRLKAIDITPDGTLQVIGGANAQGKSAVLNALWLALGGGTAAREFPRPVRDGQDTARVTLDLGDLLVERTWRGEKTALTVKAPDGAKYSSPQAMLDSLVGRLSFDPLAFTRLRANEQRDALLDLLGLNLDALDADRARLFAERTEIGRLGKAVGDVAVDESLPETETSASDLIAQIRLAQTQRDEYEATEDRVTAIQEDIAKTEGEIDRLQKVLADLQSHRRSTLAALKGMPRPADIAALEDQLGRAEVMNAAIRANNAAREQAARKAELRTEYESLTSLISMLDQEKADLIRAADLPVEGLGFDEAGVTYNSVPFAQASSAEQIRVSLAMAMAANPTLRVLRVQDGSLLDDAAMAAIREQVAERGYQLWIERVGDADQGAVIIEDGEVVA